MKPTIYFSRKEKSYYSHIQPCNTCKKDIFGRAFLYNLWSKSERLPHRYILLCPECVTKYDQHRLYEVQNFLMVQCLREIPDEAFTIYDTAPELGIGKYKDVFHAADLTNDGVHLVNKTKLSFRNQNDPDAISLEERDRLLSDCDDFYESKKQDDESLRHLFAYNRKSIENKKRGILK